MRYGMTVDEKLCVTCNACVLACKSENEVPQGEARCWTVQEERGTFPSVSVETRSERCNHCENAPCVSACPTRASHYADGGIVVVDAGEVRGVQGVHRSPARTRCGTCTPTATSTSAPSVSTG